jgi:glycosyltransferase involved in cell wall biosynthesis
MEKPFVSVIVPAYNAENTIDECLRSLLDQEYPGNRYEVIVVDNASTDGTRNKIKNFSVRYILNNRIKSSYSSRNMGIREAKGTILAFTDADCVANPTWTRIAANALLNRPGTGCVAGGIKSPAPGNCIEEYLHERDFLSQRESHKFFNFLPFAQTANAFYRKEVFDRIGLFRENWKSGGDADLSWRMQLGTDFKLEFCDDAVITHKHRTTLEGLYEQFKTHGEGQAYLYKAYSSELARPGVRTSASSLIRLIKSLFACIGVSDTLLSELPPEARRERLSAIIYTARTLGRIKGGLKNGILFI